MSSTIEEIGRDYAEDRSIEIAIKMILDGQLAFEKIAEYSGLTLEDVQELAKEVKPVNA